MGRERPKVSQNLSARNTQLHPINHCVLFRRLRRRPPFGRCRGFWGRRAPKKIEVFLLQILQKYTLTESNTNQSTNQYNRKCPSLLVLKLKMPDTQM